MTEYQQMDPKLKEFLVDYNELLSRAALEHKGSFAALASPTLNKQETVTFLYQDVVNYINDRGEKIISPNPLRLHLTFIVRLSLMFVNLIKTSLQFRIKSIPEKCLFVRTWLIPRSIQDGKVRDDYFRKLIDDLSETNTVVVGFQPLGYDETLRQFKNAIKPDNFIIPVGLLNFRDLLKIFIVYVFSAKVTLKKDYQYQLKNITNLINASLAKDYFQLRSFQAYLEHAIAKKINIYQPKTFLYIYENQSWENAFLTVFKDVETKTVGYQSSGFSFRFLNFFPSKLDSDYALFPDVILTVGDIFTNLLKDFGHYSIPVETFLALRFDYPIEENKYIVADPLPKIFKKILYAFPIHFYQYSKIIQDLIDVFKGTNIEIHLKFHPIFNNKKIKIELPKNFLRIYSVFTKSLKYNYDLVLFNDNSFGIESLLMGVRSYEYDINEYYPENRLNNFDIYQHKLKKNDLKIICEQFTNNTLDKSLNKSAVSNYINLHYRPYNGLNCQIENVLNLRGNI